MMCIDEYHVVASKRGWFVLDSTERKVWGDRGDCMKWNRRDGNPCKKLNSWKSGLFVFKLFPTCFQKDFTNFKNK